MQSIGLVRATAFVQSGYPARMHYSPSGPVVLVKGDCHVAGAVRQLCWRAGTEGGRLRPMRFVHYRYALDEIRGFDDDCDLIREIAIARISQRERAEQDRFQFVAAFLASLILIPTLVAAIYGADVKLPGAGR